ncbi:MAG: NAD(P)-dependent oxidoreductase [Rhizobiales bacterium NRL2]|jgi:NAD(P)-dependent dehydrogenase (short-subunit alcohol dehydrogenase family)|nr:MAG: NAD(P)-dependent oxidoreductase [Rhizobiales bacterium NRL2]
MAGVVIVTGGSRGIGAEICRLAGKAGYSVCVNYQSDREAAQNVAELVEAAGGKAIICGADVAQESDVKSMFRLVDQELGTITALVNNAGIVGKVGKVEELDAERINRMLAVNVTGAFLCVREAVLRMSTAHDGKGGVIVNMSSAAARLGSPGEFIDYAASKGAMDSMTIGMAKELGDQGIRVNAIRPGLIDTEIHASAGAADRVERFKDSVPMKRAGSAEEVAKAALWLMSEDSSYVNGALVDVAGGR